MAMINSQMVTPWTSESTPKRPENSQERAGSGGLSDRLHVSCGLPGSMEAIFWGTAPDWFLKHGEKWLNIMGKSWETHGKIMEHHHVQEPIYIAERFSQSHVWLPGSCLETWVKKVGTPRNTSLMVSERDHTALSKHRPQNPKSEGWCFFSSWNGGVKWGESSILRHAHSFGWPALHFTMAASHGGPGPWPIW